MYDNLGEKLEKYVQENFKGDTDEFKKLLMDLIEKIQMKAFRDGYVYAIRVLEDGVVKE